MWKGSSNAHENRPQIFYEGVPCRSNKLPFIAVCLLACVTYQRGGIGVGFRKWKVRVGCREIEEPEPVEK